MTFSVGHVSQGFEPPYEGRQDHGVSDADTLYHVYFSTACSSGHPSSRFSRDNGKERHHQTSIVIAISFGRVA